MRKLFLLPLILLVNYCSGQVAISFQLPYSGIFAKSQLWNFSVIKTEDVNINVSIEITVADAVTGQPVFTGRSAYYLLTQKFTQVQALNLSPIVYTVMNNSYNIDANPDGQLPIGKFSVCCVIYFENGLSKGDGDCTSIEVEPVSPPMLVSPADNEASDIRRPFFSWLPPAPVTGFNNLSYDFTLVTVESLQTPVDAIQQNMPLFYQNNLNANTLPFPSSLADLDTSKLYAWQVSANSANNPVAKSEVFTFKVRQYDLDTVQFKALADYYAPLKKENDATCYIFDNEVKYQYQNETNDSTGYFSIYDISGAVPKTVVQGSTLQHLKFGQNFIVLKVNGYSKIVTKHIYLLELVNSRKEKWRLKFEYRKPQN
jgi:hypothetical protein